MLHVLTKDEVHVWNADLDLSDQAVKRHLKKLSAQEKDRAERFHFQRDRSRFVVRRGVLRSLLAEYTQLKAADLVFETNTFGKPALASEFSPSVRFYVSHSGNLAVFGFALDRALGIDIEKIRYDLDCWDLAQRYFAKEEIAALAQLSGDARNQAFFNVWTRKEAYIKAIGMGVSFPLDRFAVTSGSPLRISSRRLLKDSSSSSNNLGSFSDWIAFAIAVARRCSDGKLLSVCRSVLYPVTVCIALSTISSVLLDVEVEGVASWISRCRRLSSSTNSPSCGDWYCRSSDVSRPHAVLN